MRPGRLILEAVYGSHAHGTATPTSDVDTRGVFMLPNDEFLGMTRPTQTYEDKVSDSVYWELGQFCRLLLKGNPNIVGMMFLEPRDCAVLEMPITSLFAMKHEFLHQGTARAYHGWVTRELFDIGRLHKGHAKRLSHVPRLLWELEDLVLHNTINVRLEGDRLATVMAIKTGSMDYDDAVALVGNLLLDVEARIEPVLPELPEPPEAKLLDKLLTIRRRYG